MYFLFDKPYHMNNGFQQMWADIYKIVELCIAIFLGKKCVFDKKVKTQQQQKTNKKSLQEPGIEPGTSHNPVGCVTYRN